jgi:predicted lipoprotein with Yx(FWY)xxD motif
MRTSNKAVPALAFATLAIVAAGCGGNDNTTTGGGGTYGGGGGGTKAPSATGGAAVVAVADNSKLAEILVDANGDTLYSFDKDKGGKPSCYAACANVWPPFRANGTPQLSKGAETKGAKASLVGTANRSYGGTQVTYNNLPLYTYQGDKKPGEANGNDFKQFGGEWYAVTPAGSKP